MTAPASSSMRRDIAIAYAATAAKILSWVIIAGILYRIDVAAFAMLALVRGTIGILNYTTLGLAPALIRLLAEDRDASRRAYANGQAIAFAAGVLGIVITLIYAVIFTRIFQVPDTLAAMVPWIVVLVGAGTMLRLISDVPASMLQVNLRIARDNAYAAEAECAWVLLSILAVLMLPSVSPLLNVAACYALSGLVLIVRRSFAAALISGIWVPRRDLIDRGTLKRLLAFGSLVLFAQLADYLYAPTDYILINLFLGWEQVAVYTPAMTIDSGLLLLVSGLTSVFLPRSALAHTAGDIERVRRYYIYGTLASGFLLLFAACVIWLVADFIFGLWLGDVLPGTRAILPLVLIHTVLGGSSAVGRSVMLGMGRVKPFTIAVLCAGAANVILSYIFVRHLNLGLPGIVYGTIIVVAARCAIWMPWYILRSLAPLRPK